MNVLGVYRELSNSPGRESDDALILKAVAERLMDLRVSTTLVTPEELDRVEISRFGLIAPMCETYPRLMRLKRLTDETGVVIVNTADSVLGCYRTRMIAAFAQASGLSFPPTEVRRTSPSADSAPPAFDAPSGYWVKRGDVHNTGARDVVFARDWAEVRAMRGEFESREITEMAVSRHIEGDLIKFYGVGPRRWFTWFYHDPATARRYAFEPAALSAQAELAAQAVRLDIFGGDAIVAPDGRIYVIDINSWPSFARVRAEAAVQISRLLHARLRQTTARRDRP